MAINQILKKTFSVILSFLFFAIGTLGCENRQKDNVYIEKNSLSSIDTINNFQKDSLRIILYADSLEKELYPLVKPDIDKIINSVNLNTKKELLQKVLLEGGINDFYELTLDEDLFFESASYERIKYSLYIALKHNIIEAYYEVYCNYYYRNRSFMYKNYVIKDRSSYAEENISYLPEEQRRIAFWCLCKACVGGRPEAYRRMNYFFKENYILN